MIKICPDPDRGGKVVFVQNRDDLGRKVTVPRYSFVKLDRRVPYRARPSNDLTIISRSVDQYETTNCGAQILAGRMPEMLRILRRVLHHTAVRFELR